MTSAQKGQTVKTGDLLGYSGYTGQSILPHLHFMVFRYIDPVNKPQPIGDFESLET